MNPFFSIIIPTFNAGAYLETLLRSILIQSFRDFEVLIIDGLSNDNTKQIISSFKDDRLSIFSEPDQGIYDAMNKGINKARGQWLYFIGADDTLSNSDVLAKVQTLIVSVPRCKWIYGNVILKGDGLVGREGDVYDGEFSLSKLLEKNICHQAVFYHHELFEEIGKYNLDYPILADYDFNIRAFAKHKPFYIALTIADYHTGGLSGTEKNDRFFDDLPLNALEYFKGENLFEKRFKCFSNHFSSYGRRYFYRDGTKGYLKMKLLKIWHGNFS